MLHMHLSQLKNMFPHSIQIESSPFILQQKMHNILLEAILPKGLDVFTMFFYHVLPTKLRFTEYFRRFPELHLFSNRISPVVEVQMIPWR